MKLISARWAFVLTLSTSLVAGRVDDSDQQNVLELNQRYAAASASGDMAALNGIFHRNYIHTTHDGEVRDRAGQIAFVGARGTVLESVRNEDVRVNTYGNVAVVTERFSATRTDGASPLPITERATLVWAKEADGWHLVAEQRASPVPDVSAPLQSLAAIPSADCAPAGAQIPIVPVASSGFTAAGDPESRMRSGLLPDRVRQFIRAYEPNQVGYTSDQGDDSFMDFTFSVMLPLHNMHYPPAYRNTAGEGLFRSLRFAPPGLYFAHSQRAGQYIGTRSSSPVVGKRFNPLLSLRFWATAPNREKESEDNFLEFVYAHESNGQSVSSADRFTDQFNVYFNESTQSLASDAIGEARRSARDNISRGWDYLGVQFARDWDADWVLPWDKAASSTLSLRAKLSYYLEHGLAQGASEQYNAWEDDPEGKARKYVDGISMRLAMTVGPRFTAPGRFGLERRYALTWTTGYVDPLRYNTVKVEAGVMAFGLPVMLWYRIGYNSDLVDYFRKDRSFGATLSFWKF